MKKLYKKVRAKVLDIDRAIGRRIFHSNAGLYRYYAGKQFVKNARNICQFPTDGSWEAGYKRLDNLYTPEFIALLANKFDQLINKDGAFIRRGTVRKIQKEKGIELNRILIDPARAIPETEGLLNEKLADELRNYYGAEFSPLEIQAWRNYTVPEEFKDRDLLSNHWHNDSLRSDTVKVYVALHDITDDHGPFHFIPRKLTEQAIEKGNLERVSDDIPPHLEKDDIIRFTGKAGQALLVNTTHCLHKAGLPIKKLTRDLLELRFQVSIYQSTYKWPEAKKWRRY